MTRPRYGEIDFDYAARLSGSTFESQRPVWMVNLMKYRAVADYSDGRPGAVSGPEADDVYSSWETGRNGIESPSCATRPDDRSSICSRDRHSRLRTCTRTPGWIRP